MPQNTPSTIMLGNKNHDREVAGKVNRDTGLATSPEQKVRASENTKATSHFPLQRWQSDKGGLCVFQSQAALDLGYSESNVFLF